MLTDRSINQVAEGGNARHRQAGQRRQQLLETALELFAERGWAETTMRELALRAGVAHGLVYHYFPSKQALLQEVVQHFSFLPELRQLLVMSGDRPAAEVLGEAVRRFDALLARRVDLIRLLLHTPVPEVAETRRLLATEGLRLLQEYLAARVAAGELRPHNVEATARMLMSPVIMAHVAEHPREGWLADMVPQLLQGLYTADRVEGQ